MIPNQDRRWWQIVFVCDEPDEAGARLFALGAQGIEILGTRSLRCFVEGSDRADALAQSARSFATEERREEIEEKNWVQECEEILRRLTIGAITIVPVMSASSPPPADRGHGEIRIIPGSGFGTGHHATTSSVIDLLQHPLLRGEPPRRVLDMGTGSGILALASSELYGATVDAIDMDPDAISNARENIELNGPGRQISARVGSVESASGPYSLIVANIYAEVLRSLESRFYALSGNRARLILSGIMRDLRGDVLEVYSPERWKLEDERCTDGWVSLLFTKT